MPETVVLTGITGFIAKHVALKLLAAGYRVRGTLREPGRADEVRAALAPHLGDTALDGRLEFATLDLTRDVGWSEAMAGAQALVHTASPFPMVQPGDRDAVIRPAVDGTRRALAAAAAAGVRRVVLTSSTAAVTNSAGPAHGDVYSEADWTDLDHPSASAYVASKTLAERAAWDFARSEAPGMALTTILPGLVVGPPLDGHFGTSLKLIERMLAGSDPALPKLGFPVVDVRDVAEMHLRALQRPEAAGKRYLGAADFAWFRDMALIVKAAHPDRRVTTRTAPNLAIRLLARFDPSLRAIVPLLGRETRVSTAAARADLGIAFTPVAEALRDSADWLVAAGRA